jgi:predicted methyltransferase
MSRSLLIAAVSALALAASAVQAATPANIAAAVADKGRPEADTARDADRKPAEMLAFAEVKPGEHVVDLLAGGGYFTRLFSKAVGPTGSVLALGFPPRPPEPGKEPRPDPLAAIAADPAYSNVKNGVADLKNFTLPAPVDMIWTSQNYHDVHGTRMGVDIAAFNKQVFAALKPGGLFVVEDHAAAAGAPVDTVNTLHRIDPAIIKQEVEAAGFKFEGQSDVLRNPADDHTKGVFDPALRGHTDQVVLKFRKPK